MVLFQINTVTNQSILIRNFVQTDELQKHNTNSPLNQSMQMSFDASFHFILSLLRLAPSYIKAVVVNKVERFNSVEI